MKGCFILQRNFAYLGHTMAKELREKYGVDSFCGYVFYRPSYNFLTTQTDFTYSKLLLDSEIHDQYKTVALDRDFLNLIEKEYGLPYLWPYLALDRVLMHNQLIREYPYNTPHYTHNEMLKILQVHAKAIINFLETEKPNFMVFSVIANLSALLLYSIAQKKGIKTYIIHPALINTRYLLTQDYKRFTGVAEILSQNSVPNNWLAEAQKFLNNFRNAPRPYAKDQAPSAQAINRRKQLRFLLPQNIYRNIKFFISRVYNYFTSIDKLEYDYISPINYIKDATKRKIRNIIGVSDLYDKPDFDNDQYAFFPLQYEPEMTTMLYAPYHTNQLEAIRLVARSLPAQYKLYVKEHPLMVIYRPRSYYKELKKIPNVKLINPAYTSFQILKNAKLVTTATGTPGWEASMLKIPVITFGNVFYNQLSFVKNCHALEDLPTIIKNQLENFAYNEEELIKFIAAIMQESVDVNLQYLWDKERDMLAKQRGVAPLVEVLAGKLGLSK